MSTALKRFTTPLQTTTESLSAQLYHDEQFILQQDAIGLYDGKEKSPSHVDGVVYLTPQRLIYVDSLKPHKHSLFLPLSFIKQTEYWAGFLKSSAKITLLLQSPNSASDPTSTSEATTADEDEPASSTSTSTSTSSANSWICRVCGMQNIPSAKCSLCGVPRDASSTATPPSTRNSSRPSTPTTFNSSSNNSRAGGPPIPARPTLPPPPLPPPPIPPPSTTNTTTEVDKRLPCPTCTFLNHPSMTKCELCDSSLSNSLPINTLAALSLASNGGSRPESPAPFEGGVGTGNGGQPFLRLSFRKGGEKTFYAALKKALEAKAWDFAATGLAAGKARERIGGGIDSIIKNIAEESKSRGDELQDAFKDLDNLMSNAKEMIALAQTLNERLSCAESSSTVSSPTATQTTLIRTSLQSLGLSTAVTPDMVSEREKYHEELAKELFLVLWGKKGEKSGAGGGAGGGIMNKDGIVGLDEVWCLWNRVRGIALVSPSDLKLAAPYLSKFSPPLFIRSFPSGLTVLHTSRYTLPAYTHRLLSFLDLRQALFASSSLDPEERDKEEKDGATTLEVAREEGLSVALNRGMLEEVEKGGWVVRDEQGDEGTRWFRNYIVP